MSASWACKGWWWATACTRVARGRMQGMVDCRRRTNDLVIEQDTIKETGGSLSGEYFLVQL